MSWFKRRPRLKEPQKLTPIHRSSPVSEKMMEKMKEEVRTKTSEGKSKSKYS